MKTDLIKSKIQELATLLNGVAEHTIEAGRIVAQLLDEDPDAGEKITAQIPMLKDEAIRWLERVGRGMMRPELLFLDCPAANALRRLPFHTQEKCLTDSVPLLVKTESGWESLRVDVRNLTAAQSRQVFEGSGVRSEAAQRAWLEDKAKLVIAPTQVVNLPYRISGKNVLVMTPCTLSRKDILRLLQDLE